MHCNNILETRGAVMFTDEEYSKEADTVGLGRARPPDPQGVLEERKVPLSITDAATF